MVNNALVQKMDTAALHGRVIANELTLLWHRMGLALGPANDMYLGQAEAFGISAATIFLIHYLSYYHHPIPTMTLQCFCDNLRVMTTLASMQQERIQCPNNTTNNDCNIYLEITATAIRCIGITFQYLHVQGHLDTKLDHQLTIAKQHNIDCDHFAK